MDEYYSLAILFWLNVANDVEQLDDGAVIKRRDDCLQA